MTFRCSLRTALRSRSHEAVLSQVSRTMPASAAGRGSVAGAVAVPAATRNAAAEPAGYPRVRSMLFVVLDAGCELTPFLIIRTVDEVIWHGTSP